VLAVCLSLSFPSGVRIRQGLIKTRVSSACRPQPQGKVSKDSYFAEELEACDAGCCVAGYDNHFKMMRFK
jgi:hypothetical protein